MRKRVKKLKNIRLILFIMVFTFGFIKLPSIVGSAATTLAAPTSVKAVSSSYSSINISWGAVTGANGYTVYRAASSTGTYKLISTTTSKNYNNTSLITGRTYYYKVRAYRIIGSSRMYSNYSAVVSSKPVPAVPASVKAVPTSYSNINVSWSGVTGANGYEVYKSASSTRAYMLTSTTSSVNYSNTGLTSNSTNYYKIRAYRIVGGIKVYGNFSPVASATTPGINVTSVSLNKTTDTLVLGGTDTLKASIAPVNAANQAVTWTSSDNNTVTVDNTGNIAAVNTGTAVITVTTLDGRKTAQCTVTVNKVEIKGIDVSKFQRTIDWSLVKGDGIEFAMIRSSFGDGTSRYSNNGVDSMFQTNYDAAKANGIAVGAYHYSYAKTVEQAAAEADFFISQLQGKQFEYPVCVDLEDSSQSSIDKKMITDIAITYLDKLKQAGYYPIIYTNKNWFTTILDDTRLISYDHWLAQWSSSITYTGEVGIWQYTSSGIVNGINGSVDMDTSFVDYASRIKLLHLNGF